MEGNLSGQTLGPYRIIEQIGKQLNKLIDTVKVTDLTADAHIEREMCLVKVAATAQNRAEVIEIANIFRARIIDVDLKSLTIEVVGDKEKVDALRAQGAGHDEHALPRRAQLRGKVRNRPRPAGRRRGLSRDRAERDLAEDRFVAGLVQNEP